MRKYLFAIAAFVIAVPVLSGFDARAEPSGSQKSDNAAPASKLLPLKGASPSNSCAEYGPGFVKVEGSNTCVKIGGAISVGVGTSTGAR